MHLMNHYPSKAQNNLLILSSPSWIRGGWGRRYNNGHNRLCLHPITPSPSSLRGGIANTLSDNK